jgi:hypothetical protein
VRDVGKESFGRVEGADILRKRPTLATDQQGVVETEGDDDQGHARDRENGIFPVMA